MKDKSVRYSLKVARRYCALIAEGYGRVGIHQRTGMPTAGTARKWMARHPEFRRLYEAACARRAMQFKRQGVHDPDRRGRPTLYSPDMARTICELVMEGRSLLEICKLEGMPNVASIHNWKLDHPEFDRMYRDAWDTLAQQVADETVRIADEALDEGWPERDPRRAVTAREALAHAKLKIEARVGRVLRMAPRSAPRSDAERPKSEAEMTYAERLALLD